MPQRVLPLGHRGAPCPLRRLESQSSLPRPLQVLRVDFSPVSLPGCCSQALACLFPKPGDEWGWWVGPRNKTRSCNHDPLPPLSCTCDTAMFVLGAFLFLFCFLLLEDLGCAGKERPELIQPFVSTPNATPLAAQRKFYPSNGKSNLQGGLAPNNLNLG